MNRFLSILFVLASLTFAGCAPQETSQPTPEPAPAAEPVAPAQAAAPEVPFSDEELSMRYMEAATALGIDDFEKAKAALTQLAKESTGELQKLAQTAADTGQIAALREAFKPLSEVATKLKLPTDYAVAFCPMYKGGSKWVQKRTTISNPYFGQGMATCGSFLN